MPVAGRSHQAELALEEDSDFMIVGSWARELDRDSPTLSGRNRSGAKGPSRPTLCRRCRLYAPRARVHLH